MNGIGEESCELAAPCVSRLQAGLVETPSGCHNRAVSTWRKTSVSLMNYTWENAQQWNWESRENKRMSQGKNSRKLEANWGGWCSRTIKKRTGVANNLEAGQNPLAGLRCCHFALFCHEWSLLWRWAGSVPGPTRCFTTEPQGMCTLFKIRPPSG